MNYQSLPDDVLERHLHAEPNNINMIMEAARRFSGVSERADDADLSEARADEATGELEDLKSEAEGLRDELKDVEGERDELQKELDAAHIELRKLEVANDNLSDALKASQAEAQRLETVLDMVADV